MHLLCFHIREANALIVEVMQAPQSRHLQTFLRIPSELHVSLSLSLISLDALAIIHTLSHLVTSHASSIRSLGGSILLTLFWPYRSSHEDSSTLSDCIRVYLPFWSAKAQAPSFFCCKCSLCCFQIWPPWGQALLGPVPRNIHEQIRPIDQMVWIFLNRIAAVLLRNMQCKSM